MLQGPLREHETAAAATGVTGVQHVLHRDFRTRSQLALKLVGTHKFAADPSTEVLCVAFAVDRDPVQLWTPPNSIPREFFEAARNPDWVVAAHGDTFESAIEKFFALARPPRLRGLVHQPLAGGIFAIAELQRICCSANRAADLPQG